MTLGLRSFTNSAEGALSAPDAIKIRMAEMNRSKSALAPTSNTKTAVSADDKAGMHMAHANFVDQHIGQYPGDHHPHANNQIAGRHHGGALHNQPARQTMKDFQMSQTQKLSMKSARDRPSTSFNLHNNTGGEQMVKQPVRDRSQQALNQYG